MNSLVPHEESRVCLGTQYLFFLLNKQALVNKQAYVNLKTQIDNVTSIYERDFQDLLKEIMNTLRSIDEITTGVPATEALNIRPNRVYSADSGQLDNAELLLLKTAYRKVAAIVHPDKATGNKEQFQQATLAYQDQDYIELIEMYCVLKNFPNVFWRQSEIGIEYISTEVNRPKVKLQKLKASPLFKVVQFHILGHTDAAKAQFEMLLLDKLKAVNSELNHLRKQKYHG